MTHLDTLAALAAQTLAKELAEAEPAPHDGPAFEGSHNCLANIERDYARRRRGHWFDADTLRFFGTRFPDGFLDRPEQGVTLFITTERNANWADQRRASLRAYIWKSAEVVTLGEFHAMTLPTARKVLDRIT